MTRVLTCRSYRSYTLDSFVLELSDSGTESLFCFCTSISILGLLRIFGFFIIGVKIMEPARDQLVRPLPSLSTLQYTQGPRASRGSDLLSYTKMNSWDNFTTDIHSVFQPSDFAHQISVRDETESYTVGNEVGLKSRFVRNVCNPVIKSITSLPNMANLGFADIQALTLVDEDDPLPDLGLGIIEDRKYLRLSNVLMVGKLYTPWTTSSHEMVL